MFAARLVSLVVRSSAARGTALRLPVSSLRAPVVARRGLAIRAAPLRIAAAPTVTRSRATVALAAALAPTPLVSKPLTQIRMFSEDPTPYKPRGTPEQLELREKVDRSRESNDLNSALNAYNEFKSANGRGDALACLSVIRLCTRNRDVDQGRQMVQELRSLSHFIPRSGYNVLLYFFALTRDVDGATNLWKEMREREVHPNQFSYNALIEIFARSGRPQEAWDAFMQLRENGFTPSLRALDLITSVAYRLKDHDASLSIFNELMTANPAWRPSRFAASAGVGSALRAGKLDFALQLLKDGKEKGWAPFVDSMLARTIERAFEKVERASEAEAALDPYRPFPEAKADRVRREQGAQPDEL